MNKKTISKFLVLSLGVFVLAGCGISSVMGPKTTGTGAVPQQTATGTNNSGTCGVSATGASSCAAGAASSTAAQATASSSIFFSQTVGQYKQGTDYLLTFPAGYFVNDPTVSEVTCDFASSCPCIVYDGYTDKDQFCKTIAPSSRQTINGQDFCFETASQGAAGSTYTTYTYTTPTKGSSGTCAALQMVDRETTDCSVYGGQQALIQKCEANKAGVPAVLNKVVSSFQMISSANDQVGQCLAASESSTQAKSSTQIQLKNRQFYPALNSAAALQCFTQFKNNSGANRYFALAQFSRTPTAPDQQLMASSGIAIADFVNGNNYYISFSQPIASALISQLSVLLSSIGVAQPQDKISAADQAELSGQANGSISNVTVMFFKGENTEMIKKDLAEQGITNYNYLIGINAAAIPNITAAQINALLDDNSVQWIEWQTASAVEPD
jgi:hypothetical protein